VCIERGRPWEAEYWTSGVRDQALALACLRLGREARHARGADTLPADVTAPCADALVRALDRAEMLRALGQAIEALRREAAAMGERRAQVEAALGELQSAAWAAVAATPPASGS